jgi:hypothetical protein
VTEWLHAIVDLADGPAIVVSDPCLVLGAKVTRDLSAHNCYVNDGSGEVFTIPASSPAGYSDSVEGTRFETNISVDTDVAATGQITIYYVRLPRPR